MANVDLVARLQFRGEEFTRNSEAMFGQVRRSAETTAQAIRRTTSSALSGKDAEASANSIEKALARLEGRANRLRAAYDPTAAAQQQLNRQMKEATELYRLGGLSADEYGRAQAHLASELNRTTLASRGVHVSTGQMRAGTQQLSYQIGDVSASFASGTSAAQIFGQQIGQTIQAVQLMTGASKGFIGFLAGPWGAVLTGAVTIVATLGAKYLDSASKSKQATDASKDFANTQAEIGKFIDLATGKLITQNRVLVENAALKRQASVGEAIGRIRTIDREIRTKIDKRTVIGKQFVSERQPMADVFDPDLVKLANIRGIRDLDRALTELVKRRPDLGKLRLDVSNLAAEAETLYQGGKRSEAEIALLRGVPKAIEGYRALGDGMATTGRGVADLIKKEVALSTATSNLEKARARLALVEERGAAAANAGGAAAEKYRSDLTAATEAVNRAEAAEQAAREGRSASTRARREEAKEEREAAKAKEQLQTTLEGLEAKYRPVQAAMREYKEELAQIADLEKRKMVDPTGAIDMREGALRSMLKVTQPDLFAPTKGFDAWLEGRKEAEREAKQAARDAANDMERDMERAAVDARRRAEGQFRDLADIYSDLFTGRTDTIWRTFQREGERTLGMLAARWTLGALSGGKAESPFASIGAGNPIGDLTKAIGGLSGRGQNLAGAGLDILGKVPGAGAPSDVVGAARGIAGSGKGMAGLLGTASNALGYAGLAVGAISLFKSLGSLLGPTKRGGAAITSVDSKPILSGNNSNYQATAGGMAGAVQDGLRQIATSLDAQLGAFSVAIGQYGDEYRVNRDGTKAIGGVKNAGAIRFGQDQEGAIRFAIGDAIADGAIKGISDAAARILKSGQKLETAIEKASMIEQVPKLLKQRLDPVGFAVDGVEAKFKSLFDALKEGGASTQQMADAQKLYNLELDDAKTQTRGAAESLKQFLSGMKAGGSSPLSLRDQSISARTALQPFLDQINAGQAIDQDKYQSAAQTFLDVERQLYGSTNAFFVEFDRIQKATAKAIERIDGVTALPSSEAIAKATAEATAKTAAAVAALPDMADGTNALLARLVTLNQQLVDEIKRPSASGFVGEGRMFTGGRGSAAAR